MPPSRQISRSGFRIRWAGPHPRSGNRYGATTFEVSGPFRIEEAGECRKFGFGDGRMPQISGAKHEVDFRRLHALQDVDVDRGVEEQFREGAV